MESPCGVKWMLAPPFRPVTLSVFQTSLPVPASRQTSSPDDRAEYTWSPHRTGVEVLLRILRATGFVPGQRTEAPGRPASSSSIRPLTSSGFWGKPGAATPSLLLVPTRSRQYGLPVAGSRDVTDSWVQTINCLLPPASTTIGEPFNTDSS